MARGESFDAHESPLQPKTILLKDGETIATMYPIPSVPKLIPDGLMSFLVEEFNMEIEKGDSLPFYNTLTVDEFEKLMFVAEGHICVMVLGEIPELDYSAEDGMQSRTNGKAGGKNRPGDSELMRFTPQYKRRKERKNLNLHIQWEKQCLGIFSLQSAFPGRSAHVATGTFLVNAGIRGKGIGRTLVETFIDWSKLLGYTSSFFPLIYGTNVGMRRILEDLNFRKIGKLPESGILKGLDVPVDSFMYGKEFTHITKSIDMLRDTQKSDDIGKYERLKYYLESGTYPANCDRNEKARLRVSARSHSVMNNKLMNGSGKEVVYEPDRQHQIAYETHQVEHQGINKVTTKIAEKYHWKGIKNTVTEVIAKCPKCKIRYPDGMGVVVTQDENVPQAHMLPTHRIQVVDKTSKPEIEEEPLPKKQKLHVQKLENKHLPDPTPPDNNVFNLTANTWAEKLAANIGLDSSTAVPNIDMHDDHDHKAREMSLHRQDIDMAAHKDDDSNIMDAAMLSLEDNVIAALEIVRKEQRDEDHYYH